MKVFTATLGTETNSFSAIPTGMKAFERTMLWRPGDHPNYVTEATGPLWAARSRAKTHDWTVIEGTCAFAMPGAPVNHRTYESLRDELLDQLQAAMPVDLVAFGLHGAMMTFVEPDCEGDLLEHARGIIGDDVALGAVLDLHAHLTPRMLEEADVLIAFKEYPHTDFVARSEELLDLLAATRQKRIDPVMAMTKPPLVLSLSTKETPGSDFVARLTKAESGALLSASWVHGFAAGDSPDQGSAILTIADGDMEIAKSEAESLADELQAMVRSFANDKSKLGQQDLKVSIEQASKPVALIDSADSPGGGGGGDNMAIARILLGHSNWASALGPIWDPISVDLCLDAGAGAELSLRIGGKSGPTAGPPLDVSATVIGIAQDAVQHLGDARAPVGDAVGIQVDNLAIVLTALRDQAYDPKLFETVSIDLSDKDIIGLKGSEQFRPGYGPIIGDVIRFRSPEPAPERVYRNRPRPLWPFEEFPK